MGRAARPDASMHIVHVAVAAAVLLLTTNSINAAWPWAAILASTNRPHIARAVGAAVAVASIVVTEKLSIHSIGTALAVATAM